MHTFFMEIYVSRKIVTPPNTPHLSDTAWYVLTILLFIVLVSISGYATVRLQKRFLLEDKSKELATIADMKVSELVEWRKERIAEGVSIRSNAMMAHRINDYIAGIDKAAVRQEFLLWMSQWIDLGEYRSGALVTPDGTIIVSVPADSGPPSQHHFEYVADAVREQELILSDFHRDTTDTFNHIDLTIPILSSKDGQSRCIAVLIMDIDPAKRLYPIIKSWPTTSTTAESLLVKREGHSVLFLNELRHRPNTADVLRLPLNDQNIPAVKAVLGQEGSFEGIDYRNEPVLCATRNIPGTPWGMVAKIDMSEVLAPLSKNIWMVVFSGSTILTAMILGVILWGSRKKTESLRKIVEIEQKHNLELRRSEEFLTQSRDYHLKLLEMFPSLIWRAGTDARCNYFNQTWLAFTGRTLEQELGDGWLDGVHPDDREECAAIYLEAFNARNSFVMDYRLRFNDGSYHWINDHGRPYYDQNGAFAGFIGSCYDINAQKNAETELHTIQTQLEQQILERTPALSKSNSLLKLEILERQQLEQQLLGAKRLEAIGQIAGGVAHEVRNPLNAILTITEALFREDGIADNPEFQPFILHIRTQVNRLVHLMNDLLDLGRAIPATSLQPIPLNAICRETIELWKSSVHTINWQAILTCDDSQDGILVLADGLKLQQIFFNLLENAGQHTPSGGVIKFTVICSGANLTDGPAVIQVIDQGTGIPDNKLAHVFDPFYTDRKGGTGLGLALVKHFTENMGGTVRIWNNTPPPGCTVEIRIPLYRKESE